MTGTFDDWRKTVQLDNLDGLFQKSVELPKTHTQYKVCAILMLPLRAVAIQLPPIPTLTNHPAR